MKKPLKDCPCPHSFMIRDGSENKFFYYYLHFLFFFLAHEVHPEQELFLTDFQPKKEIKETAATRMPIRIIACTIPSLSPCSH
jgi:hypothetical protein